MEKRTIVKNSPLDPQGQVSWIGKVPLLDARAVTIGSHPSNTVTLADPSVSRQHARLDRTQNGWVLRDLESTNGTFVGTQRVWTPYLLRGGERIVMGGMVFFFEHQALAYGESAATHIRTRRVTKIVRDRQKQSKGDDVDGDASDRKYLLHDIDLDIKPGEFVAILGGSGSGKSTLLNVLAGRDQDYRGDVTYDGTSLHECAEEYRSRLGFVPQSTIAHPHLTVHEALHFAGRLSLPNDYGSKEIRARAKKAMERAELELPKDGRADRISTLSGGQLKRACLAMELLRDLKLLFLDEVTSGLDAETERDVMRGLQRLTRGGTTVVCVTHHLHSLDYCDKVVFLKRGELVFSLPPSDVKHAIAAWSASDSRGADSGDFTRLFSATPRQLQQLNRLSDEFARSTPPPAQAAASAPAPRRNVLTGLAQRLVRGFRQGLWLTLRHMLLLWRDLATTLFLAIGAPIILGRLLCVLTNSMPGSSGPPDGGVELLPAWMAFMQQERMLGMPVTSRLHAPRAHACDS